jgi:hypothetical protein
MKDRYKKQFLSRAWYQWEGEEHKDRVKEGECGGNVMYSCMKMKQRLVETILRSEQRDKGE